MPDPLPIAKNDKTELCLLPALANRHGLITGATGTGKTVTLQVMAERFSRIGVPVFMADVKGDLSGITQPGAASPKLLERLKLIGVDEPAYAGCPAVFWDVFGEQGHPVRATISDLGPLLLSRVLNLNETQDGVLALVFKVADDNGLLLLDLKDLRAMLQHVGDNAQEFQTNYGNVSAASIGAIQRGLLAPRAAGRRERSSASRCSTSTTCSRPVTAAAASSTFSPPTSCSTRRSSIRRCCCGCFPSCTSDCPKSATATSRSSSSSSTKRTCCSPTRRRRSSTRSSRSCV